MKERKNFIFGGAVVMAGLFALGFIDLSQAENLAGLTLCVLVEFPAAPDLGKPMVIRRRTRSKRRRRRASAGIAILQNAPHSHGRSPSFALSGVLLEA